MKFPILLADRKALYLSAKEAYYNGTQVLSDADFDKLEDMIREDHPTWVGLKRTGVRIKHKKSEVELSHFLPSLGKAYPKDFPKWCKAKAFVEYLVMDKLDGTSLMADYLEGKPYKLYTRGNGVRGGDISFLIPYVSIPKSISYKGPVSFRFEGVMRKNVFDRKYASMFENARGLVNGMFNRALDVSKPPHELADVDLVVVGVFMFNMKQGFKAAKEWGFTVVPHKVTIDVSGIRDDLARRKSVGPYTIDGLVVCASTALFNYSSVDKPSWAIAFKDNDEENSALEAHVEKIIYQISPRGRIVPKIKIKPLRIEGVTVEYCTAHNAQWMKDRNIGPGAVVKLVRSGGVIPKIVDVVKPGKFQKPDVPFVLQGVHFVVDKDTDHQHSKERVEIMEISKFLNYMDCDFIAIKTIEHLYAAGCTTPFHYMRLGVRGSTVPLVKAGLGKVQSQKIIDQLSTKLTNVDLLQLMAASNQFGVGVGERRLKAIQAAGVSMGRLLKMNKATAIARLVQIPSFQQKTARLVADGIIPFVKFLSKAENMGVVVTDKGPAPKKKLGKGKLTGQKVSWTGYRSKEEEAAVEAAGGEVVPFKVTSTTVLLHKEGGKASTKTSKAAEKGIKVCYFSDLKLSSPK